MVTHKRRPEEKRREERRARLRPEDIRQELEQSNNYTHKYP
jgi:hypothetical protein